MIISKDLFIFGEHIFATIIPEVQVQSLPLQQQQTQQKEIAEKSVDPQKKLVVEELGGGESVAVVFVATATAATTTTTTTKKLDKVVADQSLFAKEVEENLELKENQHQNNITRNGSIKTIIKKKEETGSIEGKKINLQQKQKKAKETTTTVENKETELYNKIRRPKEKLLVVADNTNINTNKTTFDKVNEHITEEETTAIEEEEEEPLVQRNLANKLKTVSSSQQQVEGENQLVSINNKLNNTQDNKAR